MNFKCKCGAKYKIETPEFTGDIEASIYTDGVIEGTITPRIIEVFICDTCKKANFINECKETQEETNTLLLEPTTKEYFEILTNEKFKTLNIRLKAWQKSNDKYRNTDSLDDLKVKVELLKATISQIPTIKHFNQYITKMVKKKETLSEKTSIAAVVIKINELIKKREEIFGRLKEKNHLNNITTQINEIEEAGETRVFYTNQEKENMKVLLDTLGESSAEKILKAELYRNLGEFEKSKTIANEITSKQYKEIKDLIKNLSEKKLKKTTRLNY